MTSRFKIRAGAAVRRRAAACVALMAAAALGAACSIEKNYKLLSFFFDGVPKPGAVGGDAGRSGLVSAGAVSSHTAYAEQRCGECHGDEARYGLFGTNFAKLEASVCMKCHAPVLEAQPLLHGPVAAGACLWCHQPHDSPQPFLLTEAAPGLCLRCHGFQLEAAPAPSHHQDMRRSCLDCHAGHGGAQRFFLKEAPAPAPAGVAVEPAGPAGPDSERR